MAERMKNAGLGIAAIILGIIVSPPASGQEKPVCPKPWLPGIERPIRTWDYDGKQIIGHVGYMICIWDAMTGKLLQKMKSHKEHIYTVQFSPDGIHALTSSWIDPGEINYKSKDTRTIIWNAVNGNEVGALPGQVAGEFSPDGKRVITFSKREDSDSFDASVCDVFQRRQIKAKLDYHPDPRWSSLHFSPDGLSFAYVENHGGFAYLFDANDGKRIENLSARFARSIRFTSRGTWATIDANRIKLIDIKSGWTQRSIEHGMEKFDRDAWTHDGKRVAVIPYGESEIMIWDTESGKMTLGAKSGPYPLQSAIVSPEDSRLAIEWGGANSVEPGVGLYDMKTGKEITRIKLAQWGHLIGFSPCGKTFLIGGSEFIIYDSETGKKLRALKLLDDVSFEHDWYQ